MGKESCLHHLSSKAHRREEWTVRRQGPGVQTVEAAKQTGATPGPEMMRGTPRSSAGERQETKMSAFLLNARSRPLQRRNGQADRQTPGLQ